MVLNMHKTLFSLCIFVFMAIAGDVYLDSLLTRKVSIRNLATDKVMHNRISDSSICTTGIKYDYLTHYTSFPYYVQFDSSTHGIVGINTADGYDNKYLVLSGGGVGANAARSAWMAIAGNEHTIGGNIHMSSGDTGFIVMFTGRGIEFPFYANRDSGKIVLEPHTIGGKSSAIFGCKNDTAGVLMIHAGESITKGVELRHDTVHVKGHLVADSSSLVAINGYFTRYGFNSYTPILDSAEVMFHTGCNGRFYAGGLADIQGWSAVNVSSNTGNVVLSANDTLKLQATDRMQLGTGGAIFQNMTRHIDTMFVDFGDTVLFFPGDGVVRSHDDTAFFPHGWGIVTNATQLYHIKDSSGTWVNIGDILTFVP